MKRILQFLLFHELFVKVAFALISVSILILTLIPGDSISEVRMFSYDKLGHAIMFGAWTSLLLSFNQNRSGNVVATIKPYLLAACWGVLFGGAIELLQWGLPIMRTPSWADFVADVIGIVLFSTAHYYLSRYLQNQ